jgi:retron-type reverse transcriptase
LKNILITKFQLGFRPSDFAVNQLISISNDFGKAIDDGKEIRIIFCDISKAFDRVWHKGLLYKLKSIGIDDTVLKWFESYLSNSRQQVVINGETSDTKSINAGVPQGSILEPMFFLIYINDIVNNISCNTKLFADDTPLYLVVDNEYEAAEQLNKDIESIQQWSQKWLIKFNPDKTEIMTISRKTSKTPPSPCLHGQCNY